MIFAITHLRTNEKAVSQPAPCLSQPAQCLSQSAPTEGCPNLPRPCLNLPQEVSQPAPTEVCLNLPQLRGVSTSSVLVSTCPVVLDIFGQSLCQI